VAGGCRNGPGADDAGDSAGDKGPRKREGRRRTSVAAVEPERNDTPNLQRSLADQRRRLERAAGLVFTLGLDLPASSRQVPLSQICRGIPTARRSRTKLPQPSGGAGNRVQTRASPDVGREQGSACWECSEWRGRSVAGGIPSRNEDECGDAEQREDHDYKSAWRAPSSSGVCKIIICNRLENS
jgi:hypothetical protein